MPSLVESISRFVGRVEVLARGADGDRRAAEVALARGRPLEARERARALLDKVPSSPVGLALWADAAEAAWLDHEVVEALGELSQAIPWRADIWLRLGRAGMRGQRPEAREDLERAVSAIEEPEASRLALFDLCDLDLANGDHARASRWLDRVPVSLVTLDVQVLQRRAECALARGDIEEAKTLLERIGPEGPDEIDGRRSLAWARLAWLSGGATEGTLLRGEAITLAVRAYLLDVAGAADLLAQMAASMHDTKELQIFKEVVGGMGQADEPRFAAAFAFAEGRRDDARRALLRAVGGGDERAAQTLLALAIESRDLAALRALADSRPKLLTDAQRSLVEAARWVDEHEPEKALAALDETAIEAAPWADELRRSAMRGWVSGDFAVWPKILDQLHRAAHDLSSLERLTEIETLAVELSRPLRMAIIGEFNAGKSTFINALLGVDVAPTGVLPTTATLHWVAWAPDPFARVVVRAAPDRVVPHAELKATLKKLEEAKAHVERVYIYAPIERLRHVEVLDTPGFNAPDPEHARAARSAFDEAHVVVWLIDAGGAMKASERDVLKEVEGLGIPLLVLLNKADRVKPADLPTVLEHVRTSLAEEHIEGYRAPLTLSAKLALKGRLGDEAALAASGWPAVEATIEEAVVDRSDLLRERGMRRRARRLAGLLRDEAAKKQTEEQGETQAAQARATALREAAARLGHDAAALSVAASATLAPAMRALGGDLRPLSELSAESRRDEGLRAYVSDRFVARLAGPLTSEIARLASVDASESLARAVSATLAGAAAATDDLEDDVAELELARVVRAALASGSFALAAEAALPIEAPKSAITLRRLEALVSVLEPSVAEGGPRAAVEPRVDSPVEAGPLRDT